ncbi:hypothetical protein AB4383_18985 [Vibrio breoganii]
MYQWKTGLFGALVDVDFEIKGEPELSLNTGEYAYIELLPGDYEYKFQGGIFTHYIPIKIEPNKNYFFRAQLLNASDHAFLIRDQYEIDEAKKNITSGYYEVNTLD